MTDQGVRTPLAELPPEDDDGDIFGGGEAFAAIRVASSHRGAGVMATSFVGSGSPIPSPPVIVGRWGGGSAEGGGGDDDEEVHDIDLEKEGLDLMSTSPG